MFKVGNLPTHCQMSFQGKAIISFMKQIFYSRLMTPTLRCRTITRLTLTNLFWQIIDNCCPKWCLLLTRKLVIPKINQEYAVTTIFSPSFQVTTYCSSNNKILISVFLLNPVQLIQQHVYFSKHHYNVYSCHMQSDLLNCRQNKPQSFTKSISNWFFKCVSYEVHALKARTHLA